MIDIKNDCRWEAPKASKTVKVLPSPWLHPKASSCMQSLDCKTLFGILQHQAVAPEHILVICIVMYTMPRFMPLYQAVPQPTGPSGSGLAVARQAGTGFFCSTKLVKDLEGSRKAGALMYI